MRQSFISTCLMFIVGLSLRAQERPIAVTLEKGKDGASAIVVANLDEATLKICAARDAKSPDWEQGVRVKIGGGTAAELAERPAMGGTWAVVGRTLRFEPRFPLLADTALYVTVDPLLLANPVGKKSNPLVFDLRTPKKDLSPVTKLARIYPTTNKLPENHLRFYIHFSGPMKRGEAYDNIKLLDAKGKPIDEVFLELVEELWDPTMTRFTLLFHPGRVKKGLVPREELGPILEAGKSYTLVISGKWRDEEGRLLVDKEYKKEFTAGHADEEPIDQKKWKVTAPAAGGKQPLQVSFPEPLDHALLNRVLWVEDEKGKKIEGTVAVSDEETRWSFTPAQAWTGGKYKLMAETILEDLAANRIGRLFEVDVLRPVDNLESKSVEVGFEVK